MFVVVIIICITIIIIIMMVVVVVVLESLYNRYTTANAITLAYAYHDDAAALLLM
ncbi:hypothetical protein Pmar_PMAR012303 [Perkinsus marinus ATCC 50983]|uniref:Uncharacterized protein n=1 Tax=Perkinsus marinus (strain ATCC 50983 / TXsc) TaxID=423536 RepID=C5KFG0_PERM5|nr:hypothetical protein Pmar_PMAR012303 [Perkinsus marinus ATCC 50983]EER16781.1 hypothetical protein Pmar_PMAR012303 [Perkinsus marinus ATCC 50983]|eukprot:XP_002784985.1 hypothetical protein Pmar_PMAR012303 [Perkinsus marinus ATCC 50983]